MPCPLCRAEIEECAFYPLETAANEVVDDADPSDFFQNHRQQYLKDLRVKVGSNAGWTGKSAFARQIGQLFADAFEEARAERQGTERVMARDVEIEGGTVTYKVKGQKKPTVEVYAEDELEFEARALEEPVTVLELATQSPAHYWSWYRKFDGNVENALREYGLLQTERRRRRK